MRNWSGGKENNCFEADQEGWWLFKKVSENTVIKQIIATGVATVGLITMVSISAAQAKPLALTWQQVGSPLVLNGKTYVLFGHGGISNPYRGDTNINESRSLLCIKKTGAPAPLGLPAPVISPGGATTRSWSGGKVLVIPNIRGTQLTSLAVANNMCNQVGIIVTGTSGYRMAEFHDGTGNWPGWSYYAEAYGDINGLAPSTRYWVYINDQPANPW